MSALSCKYICNVLKTEEVQNVSLFMIAVSSFISYAYYNIGLLWYKHNNINEIMMHFDTLVPIVALYTITDLFRTHSYDFKMHHIFVCGIIYNYYYNTSIENKFIFLYTLLKTEISSIFYILKYWLPKNTTLYNINIILFYVTFAKLRIYDFYYDIIYNNISFNAIFQKCAQTYCSSTYLLLISCYGLYILNMYWFLIMNKIVCKSLATFLKIWTFAKVSIFADIINTDVNILCHFICSYIHWINVPIALGLYMYNPDDIYAIKHIYSNIANRYIFDITGIILLSISSYRYHYNIYKRLYNKEISDYCMPNKDNINLFLNDMLAIHARSFLVIATNYYYDTIIYKILVLTGLFHMLFIYYSITNVLDLLSNYNVCKRIFVNFHYVLTSIPIIYDILLICINSPIEIAIPFILVNILIGLLHIVQPFYKLTHVGFHVLLIVQNYYMILSNKQKQI